MTGLTSDALLTRRGGAKVSNEYGYPVAPGEIVYRGGLVGLNSSGQMQRIQTAGTVVFAGLADRTLDNTASSAASSTLVVANKGTWSLTVPSATVSNINAPVYASDDATLSLTQGSSPALLQVGVLSGIEGGQTYVTILGS